jgi:hypothetical protein
MFKNRFNLRKVAAIFACLAVTTFFSGCNKENEPDSDDFIAVTGITGVSTVAETGKPLSLTATVSPSDATNRTVVWTVKNAGTTGANITGGNTLTVSAAGTVTVTATIAGGATRTAPFAADFSISAKSAEDMPAVTGVTVNPSSVTVAGGGSQTFTATVAGSKLEETDKAVNWTVTGGVKAGTAIGTDGKLTVAADETATSLTVKAVSVVDNSKSGTATVTVTAAGESKKGIYIGETQYESLISALQAAEGTTAVISVYGNIFSSISSHPLLGYIIPQNTSITIEGAGIGEQTVYLNVSTGCFRINDNVSLTIKNISLRNDRSVGRDGSIVNISGGTFTMLEGSKITKNLYPDGNGGGVSMSRGNFIMKGGSITENSAPRASTNPLLIRIAQGGGVYMNGGTFTMEGGEITGNTAAYAGGIYIYGGSFVMKGGSIHSNIGTAGSKTLTLISPGTAVYGDGTPILGEGSNGTSDDITGRN